MSFTPSFTVGNNLPVSSTFQISDTSVGSDGAIASRSIFIYDYANNLFGGAPIQFPLSAGSSISPSILTQDQAYSITINWLDAGGATLYTASNIGCWTGFLESFYYSLTQQVAANNKTLNNKNFLANFFNLRNFIDASQQAITYGNSIYNSEDMILLAQNLVNNQALYF